MNRRKSTRRKMRATPRFFLILLLLALVVAAIIILAGKCSTKPGPPNARGNYHRRDTGSDGYFRAWTYALTHPRIYSHTKPDVYRFDKAQRIRPSDRYAAQWGKHNRVCFAL